MTIIEDYTYPDAGNSTEPFSIHYDNNLNMVEPIDFPVKNRCKRRKYKSYLGKSYETENR